MVNEKILQLITALSKCGVSVLSDPFKILVPSSLINEVIPIILDNGFKLIIHTFYSNTNEYIVVITSKK